LSQFPLRRDGPAGDGMDDFLSLGQHPLDQADVDVGLVLEIEIDCALGDVGAPGDIINRRLKIAVLGHCRKRGLENGNALLF